MPRYTRRSPSTPAQEKECPHADRSARAHVSAACRGRARATLRRGDVSDAGDHRVGQRRRPAGSARRIGGDVRASRPPRIGIHARARSRVAMRATLSERIVDRDLDGGGRHATLRPGRPQDGAGWSTCLANSRGPRAAGCRSPPAYRRSRRAFAKPVSDSAITDDWDVLIPPERPRSAASRTTLRAGTSSSPETGWSSSTGTVRDRALVCGTWHTAAIAFGRLFTTDEPDAAAGRLAAFLDGYDADQASAPCCQQRWRDVHGPCTASCAAPMRRVRSLGRRCTCRATETTGPSRRLHRPARRGLATCHRAVTGHAAVGATSPTRSRIGLSRPDGVWCRPGVPDPAGGYGPDFFVGGYGVLPWARASVSCSMRRARVSGRTAVWMRLRKANRLRPSSAA